MRRGFTIIELLVASMLLGLLTSILTMIINQSAVAWRTGTASVADLDGVRDNLAVLREEADNAFVWDGEIRRIVGLWDRNGQLNDRACDAPGTAVNSADRGRWRANLLSQKVPSLKSLSTNPRNPVWRSGQNDLVVGQGTGANSEDTYVVNVMSAGPDREFDTWDDIWSYPDDFD